MAKKRASFSFAPLTDAELAEAAMANWEQLSKVLRQLALPEVVRLFRWELGHRKNMAILKRLHQRFTRLRAVEEWNEVAGHVTSGDDGVPRWLQ